MSEPIRLDISILIPPETATLLRKMIQSPEERRMEMSRTAIFGGQKPPDEKLTISRHQLAEMMNVSTRTIDKMQRDGRMPKKIKIGNATRWNIEEIRAWIDAGCPDSSEWKWSGRST